MKYFSSLFVVIAISLGLASPTYAAVLDFEDITGFTNRANFPTLGLDTGYADAVWPTENNGEEPWGVVENADSQFATVGAFSGTQAVWNYSNGSVHNIIFDSVQFVGGAYFNVFMAQQDWGSNTVQFNAYDTSDVLIGSSAELFLDRDSENPVWQWLGLNLDGVKRLEIISTNDRYSGDGWWAMDDLALEPSIIAPAIPVPSLSQWGMILLSFLLVLGVFVNRRRYLV